MHSSILVQFSRLVSDSTTSDGIFSLLGRTIVEECGAAHALVFGTSDSGDFKLLTSYGICDDKDVRRLDMTGVDSVAELGTAVMKACEHGSFGFRAVPLISETGLFGALVVLYSRSQPFDDSRWILVEGLTELTAISLNKTFQHQKLQKAFDDLRISQDTLIRTEKFRALGQMSAGIAHDLKNLLNPLLLYTDELRDSAGNREASLDILERVDRILGRGIETVERLRDFSRLSPEEDEAVLTDLNEMAHEAIQISMPRLSGIQLVRDLGTPRPVLIRPADCVTAIVNLIMNAVDALQEKGKITVRTGESGDGSWIEVSDDGPGIPPDIKARILEPFFTTKGDLGTGLGMAIVYAFVQRYGGRLEIESEPGCGALFRMWFPRPPASGH